MFIYVDQFSGAAYATDEGALISTLIFDWPLILKQMRELPQALNFRIH